jgi:Holliday junction resolvase-like predicted endonuclease
MGYGTLAHREAIVKYGICPEHRRSFEPVKSMVGYTRPETGVVKNTTFVGAMGEQAVASYLMGLGHEIVARNFKTYFYEIDIVSVWEGRIYFTEVKYRRTGGGLDAIDNKKLEQMRFAAELYMSQNGGGAAILAAAEVSGDNYRVTDFLVLQ